MSHPLFTRHQGLLEQATQAIADRGYWSPFAEMPSPKVYGETANQDGKAAFEARLNKPLGLNQPGTIGQTGKETSPYGFELGITYPKPDLDQLFAAVDQALPAWRKAGPEAWVGVSLEILQRLNKKSFEIANAVMHTTGQAFMMAFQAGGPHAQDRGLEAVAYAWDEMRRIPATAQLGKAAGQERAAQDGKALPHRAARRRARDRLLHVPDLERLSGLVREPRHRQRGGREAASGRDPAARDHR